MDGLMDGQREQKALSFELKLGDTFVSLRQEETASMAKAFLKNNDGSVTIFMDSMNKE